MTSTVAVESDSTERSLSIFEQATRVFDGWTDAETGARVLRINPPGVEMFPGRFMMPYHQVQPFIDGGRRVLLRQGQSGERARDSRGGSVLLDLTTGEVDNPFPDDCYVGSLDEQSYTVILGRRRDNGPRTILYDLRAGKELASTAPDEGWKNGGTILLADSRRLVISHFQGKPYDEYCRTHFHLLTPGEEPTVFLELEGIFGNHLMPCPTDPDLFSYNAWPTPRWDIPGVTSIAKVDGSVNYYVPLDDNAPRPGDFWGVRDHYVWTPDGTRIVSYLNRRPVDLSQPFNHFEFDWWLSALDWRTGEDYCAQYPACRWGGHMQMTPDSQYILCGGGPGYDKLFAVDLQALKDGWNEHLICSYPTTVSQGLNSDPFPYPFALPDGSGVLFNAGWPGEEHGVYLAEWPKGL
ncbi:MAG: hypothetical protein ACYC6A_16115 [Armatimonadota bacterium]